MYELLKQLKEVGFPQRKEMTASDVYTGEGLDWVTCPTTDELIEELGDDFEVLTRSYDDGKPYYWASASGDRIVERNADTPKEALIKLYIELHKK